MIKFSLAFYSVFLLTFKSVNMYFFLLPWWSWFKWMRLESIVSPSEFVWGCRLLPGWHFSCESSSPPPPVIFPPTASPLSCLHCTQQTVMFRLVWSQKIWFYNLSKVKDKGLQFTSGRPLLEQHFCATDLSVFISFRILSCSFWSCWFSSLLCFTSSCSCWHFSVSCSTTWWQKASLLSTVNPGEVL